LRERDRLHLAAGSVNEDRADTAVFAGGAASWVIDGATGLADREFVPGAATDAAWLAERLNRYFAACNPAGIAAPRYFTGLLTAIASEYHALVVDPDAVPSYARPSAAAMWLHVADRRLIAAWQGDCRAVIATGGDIIVLNPGDDCDDAPWEDGINEVVRQRVAASGDRGGALRGALAEPLRARRSRLNQPGGYWMLGIDPRAAAHLDEREIMLDGPTKVLLASDGLWRLVDHFRRYDGAGLLAAASAKGLAALGGELRALEAADVDCRRVPRVKPYDDTTGLLLEISGAEWPRTLHEHPASFETRPSDAPQDEVGRVDGTNQLSDGVEQSASS
jgi:serine/threonine protein phosphatase PrpC